MKLSQIQISYYVQNSGGSQKQVNKSQMRVRGITKMLIMMIAAYELPFPVNAFGDV